MFSAKRPGETITLTFDFTALTASFSNTPVVDCLFSSGYPDAVPTALLSGVPVVQGSSVLQQVVAGQSGTHYLFRCTVRAADGSSVYVLEEVLPVL